MRSNLRFRLLLGGAVQLVLCLQIAGAMDCSPIVITNQPHSQVVLANCFATFTVGAMGTSPYLYQWFRDEEPIFGATNSTYRIGPVSVADNGIKIHATVANACSSATSSEALLYISLDVVPPRLLRARGDASLQRVIVVFAVGGCAEGPRLERTSAEDPYNYTFSGGLVASNAVLDSTGTTVTLDTSLQTPGALYTMTVEGVSDLSGNMIPPDSQTMFQSWVILPGSNPPSIVPPPVTVTRSGTNIVINWPQGSLLQAAKDVAGPWNTLSEPPRPHRPNLSEAAQFYRALFSP
jgi:hypothetical protein